MFPDGSASTESAWDAGDLCLIPGSGGSPGEGNGNPFQISCLENPLDGGAWRATVHGVTKSLTRLSDSSNVHVRSPALGDCPSPLPITSAPPITAQSLRRNQAAPGGSMSTSRQLNWEEEI